MSQKTTNVLRIFQTFRFSRYHYFWEFLGTPGFFKCPVFFPKLNPPRAKAHAFLLICSFDNDDDTNDNDTDNNDSNDNYDDNNDNNDNIDDSDKTGDNDNMDHNDDTNDY